MAKQETLRVAQYLLSKDEKTKYLKFGYGENATKETKDKVDAIVKALGTDILYVNLFDDDFKAQHNIPDFVKGGISVPLNTQEQTEQKAAPAKKANKASEPNW